MKFVKIEFTPDRMGPRRSADLLPAASGQVATRPHSVDISSRADSILAVVYGAFVYRLGHGPLKAERRVRFPYALPLKLRHLRKSAGRSSRFRKIFRSVSPTDFFWRGIPRPRGSGRGEKPNSKMGTKCPEESQRNKSWMNLTAELGRVAAGLLDKARRLSICGVYCCLRTTRPKMKTELDPPVGAAP